MRETSRGLLIVVATEETDAEEEGGRLGDDEGRGRLLDDCMSPGGATSYTSGEGRCGRPY